MDSNILPDLKAFRLLKKNQIWLSVDLETPNRFGAGIFSIGITPFDLVTGEVFKDLSFYIRMDFVEVLDTSNHVGDTMKWWMQQSEAARLEVISTKMEMCPRKQKLVPKDVPCFPYEEAMMMALSYIMSVKDALLTNGTLYIMGNGSVFDVAKFEDTLRQFGIIGNDKSCYSEKEYGRLCYNFWEIMDLRSFVQMAVLVSGKQPKKLCVREGTHHNAVDDAIYQAQLAIKARELCDGTAPELKETTDVPTE